NLPVFHGPVHERLEPTETRAHRSRRLLLRQLVEPLLAMLAGDVGELEGHVALVQEGDEIRNADAVDAHGGRRQISSPQRAHEGPAEHRQVAGRIWAGHWLRLRGVLALSLGSWSETGGGHAGLLRKLPIEFAVANRRANTIGGARIPYRPLWQDSV